MSIKEIQRQIEIMKFNSSANVHHALTLSKKAISLLENENIANDQTESRIKKLHLIPDLVEKYNKSMKNNELIGENFIFIEIVNNIYNSLDGL